MALLDARALRDALRNGESVAEALAIYQRPRRAHVGICHFWSRWLTSLFQSERDFAARWRDRLFPPMSRTSGAHGQMLRVLSGIRKGWLGRMALPEGFGDAIAAVASPCEFESRGARRRVNALPMNPPRETKLFAERRDEAFLGDRLNVHRVLNETQFS